MGHHNQPQVLSDVYNFSNQTQVLSFVYDLGNFTFNSLPVFSEQYDAQTIANIHAK